jgi:rhodanese-related sulfurtransferase
MNSKTPFRRINVEAARDLMTSGNLTAFDVRDPGSYQRAHIEQARPLSDATLAPTLMGTPKDKPILIYCYHGRASQVYAQTFADFGFREVYSLDGGYEGWKEANSAANAATGPGEPLQSWLAAQGFGPSGINVTIDNGMTPLMKAARFGDAAIVAALLQAGARLDSRNADGNTALWLACVGGEPECVALLIRAGIDIDNRNDNGATCLMYASSTGKAPLVEMLIAAGAGLKAETLDGFTALDMASTFDCLQLLRNAEKQSRRSA